MSEYVCELFEYYNVPAKFLKHEEIVRCRDCKHYYEAENYHPSGNYVMRCCKYFDAYNDEVEPDGFCAWGERNDDSTPKNDVGDPDGGSNVAWIASSESSFGDVFVDGAQVFPPTRLIETENETGEQDTREKLEADIEWCCLPLKDQAPYLIEFIFKWLNRQAAITRAECERGSGCPGYDPARHYCKYHAQDFGLNDRTVSRLKRENAGLARDLAECERMREGLRARLSEAIGKASEIAALGDL